MGLGEAFRAVAEALRLVNRRTDLRNAPEVQKAVGAQREADEQARVATLVEKQDVKGVRDALAE